eukprot:TRINITY_DN3898_c0_g1_i6.p1 TRINITY_DN3898_c0_g1~~TRINITY_DN3898_c0_g1_i6.p1  ORF type:complete len:147 (+),score=16.64 TRINITY_DN3898_c0_g1_i6:59-442(+)
MADKKKANQILNMDVSDIDPARLASMIPYTDNKWHPIENMGNMPGDGWLYSIGMSYLTGSVLGNLYGISEGLATSRGMNSKLRLNSVLNCMGKRASRVGNAFAALGILILHTLLLLLSWQALSIVLQ